MSFADFLASFWWLLFPAFGMAFAILRGRSDERIATANLAAIKAYVDQGREPPAELLKRAGQ